MVNQIADRVLVMEQGRIVEEGPTENVLTAPAAAYTRTLIDAVPRPGWVPKRREMLGSSGGRSPL